MTTTMNQRGLAAGIALAVCFTGLSYRLVHLQVTQHKHYEGRAAKQNLHNEPIYARRGAILDVNGVPLAQNEPVKTVVADGSLIKDYDGLAQLLSGPLKMEAAVIRAKLGRKVKSGQGVGASPLRYIVLRKGVSEVEANEIARLVADTVATPKKDGLVYAKEAVRYEQDFVRVYPNGSSLCHVVGFVNDAGTGMDGIEASMNDRLASHDGSRYVERDRTGRELVLYRGQETPPTDGGTVRLTIDLNLQQIVENELDIAMKQTRPKKASVIMMNPKTGEIMAMANRPHFNPNAVPKQKTGAPDTTRNIAVTDQVDPGSTFKIVPLSAALTEGLVSLDTEIWCENRYWRLYKLRDSGTHGMLSVRNVLAKSSNIGTAKIAMQLGDQKFYEYARKFGFGDKTGVNLPFEIRGSVLPPDKWDKFSLSRMAIGQSLPATPLQIANAMCVIANGGTLLVPQIIRDVAVDGRTSEYKPQDKWRVVSQRSTAQMRDALMQVVGPKGTAALAHVPGFKVAGKTGTAQKFDENGRVSHDKHVLSFIGYLPADDPAFVLLVLLDEPQADLESHYGGVIAGPVFSRIAEKAARYLNLQPTEPILPPGAAGAKGKLTSNTRD